MGYLSISLYHLQIPSSMFYSFLSIGLSSPWLSLILGILIPFDANFFLIFDAILNRISFYFHFSVVHY